MFLVIILFIISLFAVFTAIWYYTYNYYTSGLTTVKGPKPVPLLGNALEFSDTASVLPNMLRIAKEYDNLSTISMLYKFWIVVMDYDFLETVMSSTKLIDKADQYKFIHNWLGTGLLTSTGQKWKKRRKLITPTFHFNILEKFVDVFNRNSDILIEELRKEVGKESTNVFPYITLYALDVICETSMGTSVNAQQNQDSQYVQNVKIMCKIMMERVFSPFQQYDILYYLFPNYWLEKKTVKMLHDFTNSVIKKRRETLALEIEKLKCKDNDNELGMKRRVAFLDLLLQSTVDGQPLSDEDIREEVDTFMFEGHDTTTSGISFALFSLSNNKNVQDTVMDEQRRIFSDDKDRHCTYQDLMDMKYLELVIKETLRLYPSVPFIGRELKEDFAYSPTDTFKKGSQLFLFTYGIQRDAKYFPDPEKFDPLRFSSENVHKLPYSYIPFSAGPRNCIGQKFAMLELKASLSKILRRYELLPLTPAHEPILLAETVLKSRNGLLVQFKDRKW